MFRLLFFTVAVLVGIAAVMPVKVKPVTQTLKLKWKCEIGNTTDRTRPVISGGYIWIGSNGSRYNDYALDYGNGIYKISASTGKVAEHFLDEQVGDMDVNGILKINDLFYAGSDNEELTCFDASGKVKWRVPAGGDIEHRPTHVRLNDKDAVIYATENGEISAVDVISGKRLWSYYHPEYKGWKPGENRFVFKVNNHFYADFCFFSEPAIADLNNDGTDDVIYGSFYSELTAVNGKTGKKIFGYNLREGESASLLGRDKPLISKGKQGIICWIPTINQSSSKYEMLGLNTVGQLKYRKSFGKDIPLNTAQNSGVGECALNNGFLDLTKDLKFVQYKSNEYKKDKESGQSYIPFAGARYADNKIKMNGEICNVLLFEYAPERSTVMVIGQKTGVTYLEQVLEASSEFIPVVEDVDTDGKVELLVSCRDGKLYCYSLGISTNQLVKP
jgi:hypothetical protein